MDNSVGMGNRYVTVVLVLQVSLSAEPFAVDRFNLPDGQIQSR